MLRKIFPIFLITWGTFAFGQSDTLTDRQLKYVYKNILKTDQTHLKDQEIRNLIFLTNFDQIIKIIRNQGYPKFKVEPKKKKDRTLITMATEITFFHILQTTPETLLNPEIIGFVKSEIDANRMPKHNIYNILRLWKKLTDLPENESAQKLTATQLRLYESAINTLDN